MEVCAHFSHNVTCMALDPSTSSMAVGLGNGEIAIVDLPHNQEGEPAVLVDTGGCPSGIVFDETGRMFIADLAHKAIVTFADGESLTKIVDDYEGVPFKGPNSLCLDHHGTIFFTDSGPLGTTTLEKANGSVYAITGSDHVLVPILLNCLAHPSGICLSPDGSVVYVAETMRNRIVRLARSTHSEHVFHASVFYRFQGGLGPMGVACDRDGNLVVAHHDLPMGGDLHLISPKGAMIGSVPADRIRSCICPDLSQVFASQGNAIVRTAIGNFRK